MASLKLKTTKEPTFWNEDALIGAGIGSMLPIPFSGVAGGLIGGFMGKNRMESNLQNGKDVSEPSYFNKGLLKGGIIGSIIGAALFVGIAALAISSFGGTTALALFINSGVTIGIPGTLLGNTAALGANFTLAAAAYLGSTLLGGIIGSVSRRNKQEGEYKEAQAQEQERSQAIERTRSQGLGKGINSPSVSPDIAPTQDIDNSIHYRNDFLQNELSRRGQAPKQLSV